MPFPIPGGLRKPYLVGVLAVGPVDLDVSKIAVTDHARNGGETNQYRRRTDQPEARCGGAAGGWGGEGVKARG